MRNLKKNMQFSSAGNCLTYLVPCCLIIVINIAWQCQSLEVVPTLSANYIYYHTKHQNHRYDDGDNIRTTSIIRGTSDVGSSTYSPLLAKNSQSPQKFPQYVRKPGQSTVITANSEPSEKNSEPREKVPVYGGNKSTQISPTVKNGEREPKNAHKTRNESSESNISPLRAKTSELQQKIQQNLENDGYIPSESPIGSQNSDIPQEVSNNAQNGGNIYYQLPLLPKYSELQRQNLRTSLNGGYKRNQSPSGPNRREYVPETSQGTHRQYSGYKSSQPSPRIKTSEFLARIPDNTRNGGYKSNQSPARAKSSENNEKIPPRIQVGGFKSKQSTANSTDSEFRSRMLPIDMNSETVLADAADKRTGVAAYKKMRSAKWKYICCIVLRWFKKTEEFPKVRRRCRRFKCYADTQVIYDLKPTVKTVTYHEPEENSFYKEWGQEEKTEVAIVHSPKTKTKVHHDNSVLGFSFAIVSSMLVIFTGIIVFLGLLNGSKEHKHIKMKVETLPTHPNEVAQELIQHIHIHLKGKHGKKKGSGEDKEKGPGEHEKNESKQHENHESEGESESEEVVKERPQNSEENKSTPNRRANYQISRTKEKVRQNKKPVQLLSTKTKFLPIAAPIPSVDTNTQLRADLEAKELTKEILGLTAEGMHTAAYSLLLVNVLGEILEDALHLGGGGEGIPPGGELLSARNITLSKNHTLSKTTANLLADKQVSKTLLGIASRFAADPANNHTLQVFVKKSAAKKGKIPALLGNKANQADTPFLADSSGNLATNLGKITVSSENSASLEEKQTLPRITTNVPANQQVKHTLPGYTTKYAPIQKDKPTLPETTTISAKNQEKPTSERTTTKQERPTSEKITTKQEKLNSQEFMTGFSDEDEIHIMPGHALKFLKKQGVKHTLLGFTAKFTSIPEPATSPMPMTDSAAYLPEPIPQPTSPKDSTDEGKTQSLQAFTTNAATIRHKNKNVSKFKPNSKLAANQVWKHNLLGFTTKFGNQTEDTTKLKQNVRKTYIFPETTTTHILSAASIENINRKASAGVPMVGYERKMNFPRRTTVSFSAETLNRRATSGIPTMGLHRLDTGHLR